MKNNIYSDYPDLIEDLNAVKQVIDTTLDTSEERFSNVVKATFNENSKLIRPALVLISSSYKKNVKEKAINLAAAVEMMHVASLVHDDIIDEAKVRRHQTTINEQYDIGYAVICGDYLFTKAFQLIFDTQDLKGISLMGANVNKMVFGEVEQYLDKYNEDISIERYFSIIEKKTASFFATSLVLGARLAQVKDNEVNTLEKIGIEMGMLFQIQDDLLDFKSEQQIGKSSMSDINRGTYSLPVIIALENSTTLKNHLLNEEINFNFITNALIETNALNITQEYLDQYYEQCITTINSLSNKDVQEKLTNLVNKLINRTY